MTAQALLNLHAQGRWALAVDGHFGPKTRAWVKSFQATHYCVADGIVGARTWAALLVPNGSQV